MNLNSISSITNPETTAIFAKIDTEKKVFTQTKPVTDESANTPKTPTNFFRNISLAFKLAFSSIDDI